MDRVTKSLLDEFVKENALESLPEETAFEHFTGYIVSSRHYTESFSSEDIHVGAGNDCGIDTLTIIVNGCLVVEPEEIEDLCETNGYLDVTFIFNQAERSSGFETAKVGQFYYGVNDFFKTTPSLPQNDEVRKKFRISNEIFGRSSKFKKGNPQCYLYYSTTGKWTGDAALSARKDSVEKDLMDLSLFRKVEFEFIDAAKVQTLFRETKNAISTEINFPERTVIPELPGVEQAFLGLLSATEYIKLIQNTNEEVITSIFYDNVRHWQEWNPVNKEMRETLSKPEERKYFPLLNNGVTVIAKRILPTGNKFVVEDYQIVNGCQTSYVLHECREHLDSSILVPIRLVATDNPEIRNSIIKATNRQTEVSEEQLFALADFPKKLEAYFPTFEGNRRLYYERRSRQYSSDEDVEKVRIVNMTNLVKAHASMFLGVPHRTSRNYKALLKLVGGEIFHKDDRLEMYYVSAFAQYKLEYFFRSGALNSRMKSARYHLLYLFRQLANRDPLPRRNSHEMARYCDKVMSVLWDDSLVRETFSEAAAIVEAAADGNYHSDNVRTEPFTKRVEQSLTERRTTA